MRKIIAASAVFFLIINTSCKKNQLDGTAVIQGKVTHHEKPIPNARVFIKFNAKEFPGTDTTLYDARFVSDATASYSIKCYKGDYYLYGIGFDTGINMPVTGGLPVHIRSHEVVNTEVPVSE